MSYSIFGQYLSLGSPCELWHDAESLTTWYPLSFFCVCILHVVFPGITNEKEGFAASSLGGFFTNKLYYSSVNFRVEGGT